MKNVRTYRSLMILGCMLLGCIVYIIIFRPLVIQVYEGSAPYWFEIIIDYLYPRLEIEKQRFELGFFLSKADQILIRSCLVCLFFIGILWFYDLKKLIKLNLKQYSRNFYRVLISLFYIGLLYFTWDWFLSFEQFVLLKSFYKGVFIFRALHLPILPIELFYALHIIFILSIILIWTGFRQVLCSTIASLLFLFFQGYSLSFEKIDHGYATLSFVMILMPFMIYELKSQQKNRDNEDGTLSSFTLFLIQLSIASTYLLTGLEKLLTSGFAWATANTFRTYIEMHDQPIGLILAKNDVLANLLPVLALLFQLSFILILFYKRLRLPFLVLGILFHLGTKLLLGIGPYFSSWVFVYIFFIDWDWVYQRWVKLIANKHRHSQKGT